MGATEVAIEIPLQGGLGNQLFQVAAGIVAAGRAARPIRYSDYWLEHPPPGETPRRYMLGDLLEPTERTSEFVRRAGRVTDRMSGRACFERGVADDAVARLTSRTRLLVGYFQRLAYVEEAWPELRRRVEVSHSRARGMLDAEQADYGAIHYRLGDYVSNPAAASVHGALGPEYFVAAITEGLRKHDLRRWIVVSDDPLTARRLLEQHGLPIQIELDVAPTTDEWSDLAVLSAARLCVISNSSFSWWAAFIGSTLRFAEVVFPRPWFLTEKLPDPLLFPPTWHGMPRNPT